MRNDDTAPCELHVIRGEAREFLETIQEVTERPPSESLYLMNLSDGLPISFDRSWQPYIGNTRGFNWGNWRPLSDRIRFIERVKPLIQKDWHRSGERIRGGRYFFSKTGIVRKSASGRRRKIVTWVWPDDLSSW